MSEPRKFYSRVKTCEEIIREHNDKLEKIKVMRELLQRYIDGIQPYLGKEINRIAQSTHDKIKSVISGFEAQWAALNNPYDEGFILHGFPKCIEIRQGTRSSVAIISELPLIERREKLDKEIALYWAVVSDSRLHTRLRIRLQYVNMLRAAPASEEVQANAYIDNLNIFAPITATVPPQSNTDKGVAHDT